MKPHTRRTSRTEWPGKRLTVAEEFYDTEPNFGPVYLVAGILVGVAALQLFTLRGVNMLKKVSEEELTALQTAVEQMGTSITGALETLTQTAVKEAQEIQVALERLDNQHPEVPLGPLIARVNALTTTLSDGLSGVAQTVGSFVNPEPEPDPTEEPEGGDTGGGGGTEPAPDNEEEPEDEEEPVEENSTRPDFI